MLSARKIIVMTVVAMLLGPLLGSPVVWAQEAVASPEDWMEGCSLFITDAGNIDEAYEASVAVGKAGGRIGVIVPNQVMLGWVPAEKVKGLLGKARIRKIYQKPLTATQRDRALAVVVSTLDGLAENTIDLFNRVVTGEYKEKAAAVRAIMEASTTKPAVLPDASEAPSVSYDDIMANLKANGITEEILKGEGITIERSAPGEGLLSPGNSDYMVGNVVFNSVFIESKGPVRGVGDPDSYTWTASAKNQINSEIVAGLMWWVNKAKENRYKVPLTFVVVSRDPFTTASVYTRWEPILHSSKDDYLWIQEIMANFGFGTGDKIARTTAFNTAEKIFWKANWAVTSFIAYNPPPAPRKFTNGKHAYSYLRGPYSQLLYDPEGWGTVSYDVVNAHHTGHLFGASEEHYQAGSGGCGSCGPVSNGVLNGNCERCNPDSQPCMMRNNENALCGYTPGQLGWSGVQYIDVEASTVGDETYKDFFAPGEKVKYQAYGCLAGPGYGTDGHTVRVRYRANFFAGATGESSTLSQNTPWLSGCCIPPPAPAGLTCFQVWVKKRIPLGVAHGPATLDFQIEVVGIGKGAVSGRRIFYVAPGAEYTESAQPAVDSFEDEELVIEPAPPPWKRAAGVSF